jgi:hypothetical protein
MKIDTSLSGCTCGWSKVITCEIGVYPWNNLMKAFFLINIDVLKCLFHFTHFYLVLNIIVKGKNS